MTMMMQANKLLAPLSCLPETSAKQAERLEHSCSGTRIIDILTQLPSGIVWRPYQHRLNDLKQDAIVTVRLKVQDHHPPAPVFARAFRHKKQPWRISCSDAEGHPITLVFFHAKAAYLSKTLKPQSWHYVCGKISVHQNQLSIIHPYEISAKPIDPLAVVYPLTQGLTLRQRCAATQRAFAFVPNCEWLDAPRRRQHQWPLWKDALWQAHHPQTEQDLLASHPCRLRLAYDELLAQQLTYALLRLHKTTRKNHPLVLKCQLRARIEQNLPFQLNDEQRSAVDAIIADMTDSSHHIRLLQGEVGSGKTIVALLALAEAIDNKRQGIFMAPTELLARQIAQHFAVFLRSTHVPILFISGQESERQKKDARFASASGIAPLIVGTHALFQETMRFHHPALIVIDEQHRFGVEQRKQLQAKAPDADVVLMSATPIPRSLALAHYGDLPLSTLTQRATKQAPARSFVIAENKIADVLTAIENRMAKQQGCYWVCPLIHESQEVRLMAAEKRFLFLRKHFGERVALLHGGMASIDRMTIIDAFQKGFHRLLVCTTVIETGIDIPSATLIVVEHAERFGLSQLHQLRGRVARHQPGDAIFLYHQPLTPQARQRLEIIRSVDDGFALAEQDLLLRGEGDLIGTKQSGMPPYRLAMMPEHQALLIEAHDHARSIIRQDPFLKQDSSRQLRFLLALMASPAQSFI